MAGPYEQRAAEPREKPDAEPNEQKAADPSVEQDGPNERRTALGARQTEPRAASAVLDAGQAGQDATQAVVYDSADADRKR